jgi:hypothetical protein
LQAAHGEPVTAAPELAAPSAAADEATVMTEPGSEDADEEAIDWYPSFLAKERSKPKQERADRRSGDGFSSGKFGMGNGKLKHQKEMGNGKES